MNATDIIKSYISSSEFNRLKKHGIYILSNQIFDRTELYKTGSINKKLKRKLNTLHNFGIIKNVDWDRPLIGVFTPNFDGIPILWSHLKTKENQILVNWPKSKADKFTSKLHEAIAKMFLDKEDEQIMNGKT